MAPRSSAPAFEEDGVPERAHVSVLLAEAIEWLAPRPGQTFVDGTLGAGGHAEALLAAVGPGGSVIGIDRDPTALDHARRRLARFGPAFRPVHGNHRDLRRILAELGVETPNGALFDLGFSSMQMDDPARGFSFQTDGPLDMRMDPGSGETAAELLARLGDRELSDLFRRFGEEPQARRFARAIVRERERSPIMRTKALADLVARAAGPAARFGRIHPATRVFQALRIAVNDELEGLDNRVAEVCDLLGPGGRAAWIAFHSLEDRQVKQTLRRLAAPCTCPPDMPRCGCGLRPVVRVLTPRPVYPSAEEISTNPRARSGRLRAAEKL